MSTALNTYRNGPDEGGHFGIFGGRFVAETLMPLVLEVEKAYTAAKQDPAFIDEFEYYKKHYIGRPSPLFLAARLSAHYGGAKLYLKRDELNHTGAHKINNVMGQALLPGAWAKPKSSPKPAPASMAWRRPPPAPCLAWNAKFTWAPRMCAGKSPCRPDAPAGRHGVPVTSGSGTLKDAMNEALRTWVAKAEPILHHWHGRWPAPLSRHGA